jgi:hypothetical protein
VFNSIVLAVIVFRTYDNGFCVRLSGEMKLMVLGRGGG